ADHHRQMRWYLRPALVEGWTAHSLSESGPSPRQAQDKRVLSASTSHQEHQTLPARPDREGTSMGFKQWSSAALALCAGNALALAVGQFSPQGEVEKVQQVRVQFDAAAVRFG